MPNVPGNHYPTYRARRLRRSGVVRDSLADVTLCPDDLVMPLFVTAADRSAPVESMPGVQRLTVDDATEIISTFSDRGLRRYLLFGVTPEVDKDSEGSFAGDPSAPVNRVLAAVRDKGLDVWMMADLCLCEYTDHGHCGVLSGSGDTRAVDNDRTLDRLGEVAKMLASHGADVVAPSGMMDGQVGAVRGALDEAGHPQVAILSYSIKYASSFYGPFRDAGGGGMKFGNRKGYQMDPRRAREWRVELQTDLAEGTDMVMVKPAVPYLDIVRQVRDACDVPVAAYHVSGEYSMLIAAAERGWIDLKEAMLESMVAIKRAGADLIVTYGAPKLLDWI